MKFYVSTITDVGIKRKENQDSLFAATYFDGVEEIAFAVLCDGMGGLAHGAMASASIVSAFSKWAEERLTNLDCSLLSDQQIRMEWTDLVQRENEKLVLFGRTGGAAVGSTLTAALLTSQRYYVLNIGDSRTYFLNENARQITLDHTIVAEEVRKGNLSEAQAECAPIRNVLTRCVGVAKSVQPDFFFGVTEKETVCLLCSDGFRHKISKEEMKENLLPVNGSDGSKLSGGLKELVELNKARGETDNISAVAIYIQV